jgi:hypothetical protein
MKCAGNEMMRRGMWGWTTGAAVGGVLGLAALTPARAQMHAVKAPDQVVRAVAVYEYTGADLKPTASRVVPVSLFIDGKFQDAGLYLARPVPFALDTGVVYELRKSGVGEGTLELAYQHHLVSEDDNDDIDDGWMAYGKLKAEAAPTVTANAKAPHRVDVSGGKSNQPKSGRRSGSETADVDDDSDAPVLHRRAGSAGDAAPAAGSGSGGGTKTSSAGTPGTGGASGSKAPADGTTTADSDTDPADQPTLKRRTPAQIKSDQKKRDSARVTGGNDLNDDPDRPTLHRGTVTESLEQQIPPLHGMPQGLHQMVAVSDAKSNGDHDFRRPWMDEAERKETLAKMEEFARAQLSAYKGVAAAPPAAASGPSFASTPTAPAPAASVSKSRTAASRAKKAAAAAAKAAPVPITLTGEELKGYTLSYGGAATFVYSASSPGVGGVARYVTVVAQEEPTGGLKMALASVTDAKHLDRTAWMRPLDVVDADGSNRASLLMELRAEHTRQFALYRVIGAEADQVFVTGATE